MQQLPTSTSLVFSRAGRPEPDAAAERRSLVVTPADPLMVEVPIAGQTLRLERLPQEAPHWQTAVMLVDALMDLGDLRARLRCRARALELGCGLGLPGMICAALGGRAVLTDLPVALEAASENAAANGWPQYVWRVVAAEPARVLHYNEGECGSMHTRRVPVPRRSRDGGAPGRQHDPVPTADRRGPRRRLGEDQQEGRSIPREDGRAAAVRGRSSPGQAARLERGGGGEGSRAGGRVRRDPVLRLRGRGHVRPACLGGPRGLSQGALRRANHRVGLQRATARRHERHRQVPRQPGAGPRG
ncbi:unnamed protein product [Prorocentrum cordatum]|uniref:Calmodulin-lysine N-methyltransferase n=1 Tax=Prorocentrum cordatum TaxID=2364126 RepID=A0ABN9SMB0_9DINO|nr:unnamed protein product [Polarella glacialis]